MAQPIFVTWRELVWCGWLRAWRLLAAEVVVVDFNAEDNGTHCGGADVSHKQWHVAGHCTLNGKKQCSKSHHRECAHGDVVG